MTMASDVTAIDATGAAVTASGTFPERNTFTVTSVSNPMIATLTVTSPRSERPYAATRMCWWVLELHGGEQPGPLKGGLKYRSASKSDVQNVKLYVNGASRFDLGCSACGWRVIL